MTSTSEQLGSNKLEVRLGGIYSLERISKESPDDLWTVGGEFDRLRPETLAPVPSAFAPRSLFDCAWCDRIARR
jgi:hypothetical protein